MNLEEFPPEVKMDIEDQSLALLDIVKDDIIVIGGWAVRALAGERHARYTLDIDGVLSEESVPAAKRKLVNAGLEHRDFDWGYQFTRKYEPEVDITDRDARESVGEVELRIELSGPKIREFRTHHYFEFSLEEYVTREIAFHRKDFKIAVKVPPAETMAAVKLGLPVDYKNNFDSAVLLQICDIDSVIEIIKANDDWREIVLRRIPKSKDRIRNPGRLEHILSINIGVNVRDYVRKLEYIETDLRE
ncbi:MAG: hypothetical protein ACE5QW_07545 [Thermoplasmata archaeon]